METGKIIFARLKEQFAAMADEHGLTREHLRITARGLSSQEAIGNPEETDYPILKGKEKMMEAVFRGAKGQAFTDMCREWSGSIGDVLRLDLRNNFQRAVFVASLNAVTRSLGLTERTVHCRDDSPERCGTEFLQMLHDERPEAQILLVGHQPRILQRLSSYFHMSVVDMDKDNIGKTFFGVTVQDPEETERLIDHADLLLVTGTTLVNGTIADFLNREKPVIFYGITISAAAKILGLRRFCPFGL
jgi:hypothetical protein